MVACALRNEQAVRAHRLRLSSVCEKRLSGALRSQQLKLSNATAVAVQYATFCLIIAGWSYVATRAVMNKTLQVRINVTFRRVHVTIVVVDKQ